MPRPRTRRGRWHIVCIVSHRMATRASSASRAGATRRGAASSIRRGCPSATSSSTRPTLFPTIELNGSFYSLQRPEYYERWYEQVPRDFVFAVKGSRYITHMMRLRGVETALANFFASGVLALEHKLGPLLWQLPPTLKLDESGSSSFSSCCRARRRRPRSSRAGTTSASRAARTARRRKIASCATRSKCGIRASRRRSSSSCCASKTSRSSSPTPPAAGRSSRT